MALSKQDLAIRSTALWSTEAAAALGLSKYGSPISLWLEKTNQQVESAEEEETDDDEVTATEAQSMGLMMQPIIARLYTQRTGEALDDLEGLTKVSDSHPFMASHFDYRPSNNRRKLVECKNFHSMRRKEFGEEGSDDVPMDILVQCLHEAHCHGGIDSVDVPVLFGGQKFEIFTVPIRSDSIDMLVDKLHIFWHENVIKRQAPAPQTDEEAKALWVRDNGQDVIATEKIEQTCSHLKSVKDRIKEYEAHKDGLSVLVKSALGEAAVLRSADRSRILATWKSAKSSLKFDEKRFAIENAELYARYCAMVPGSRRFLLK